MYASFIILFNIYKVIFLLNLIYTQIYIITLIQYIFVALYQHPPATYYAMQQHVNMIRTNYDYTATSLVGLH